MRPQPLRWFGYAGGLVELGHDGARDGAFCFDNETPRHRAFAAPFELASRPATYGDFLAFIEDDGYARPELWLSMGWDWVRAGRAHGAALLAQRRRPLAQPHACRALVEIDPQHAGLPPELLRGRRVRALVGRAPAERARVGARGTRAAGADRPATSPTAAPSIRCRRRIPVGDEPVQMFGDVWEWTQSAYLAYPGYRPLPGAVGEYNGKFMCNQFVLRGGSCATPAGHVRASYRNFFPPEAQWQFSGVRLARDA